MPHIRKVVELYVLDFLVFLEALNYLLRYVFAFLHCVVLQRLLTLELLVQILLVHHFVLLLVVKLRLILLVYQPLQLLSAKSRQSGGKYLSQQLI